MKKLIICLSIVFVCANGFAQEKSLSVKDGNIFYGQKQLTDTGRDRGAVLHPNGKWIYFVRTSKGRFVGERFYPVDGQVPKDGILKEELWRINTNGSDEHMLYRNSTAAIDHPSGYAYALIDNIQLSPDGDKVYFETSRWVTSNALNVMDPDGSNVHMLGPGNNTKIILSARTSDDREQSYKGYIVTSQRRYWFYGGSYDWYYLFTPDLTNEIAPLGDDPAYFTEMGDLRYTDSR